MVGAKFVPHKSAVAFVKYMKGRGKTFEQILKTCNNLASSYRANCIDPCTQMTYGDNQQYSTDSRYFSDWSYEKFVGLEDVQ